MSIFKKNNRVWIDLFTNGARIRKSTGLEWTPQNVKKVENDLIPSLKMGLMAGTVSLVKEECKSVTYYAHRYLESKKQTTVDKTYRRYASIVQSAIIPLYGDKPIKALRISHMEKWREELLHKFTAKTVKEYQSVFRGIFQKALHDEEVNKNPFDALEGLKVKKPHVEPFMPHEVKTLLDSANGWFKNYLALGFMTGMRVGEIVALKWENINFDKKEIFVNASRCMGVDGTTKNQGSIRYIPIMDSLLPFLVDQWHYSGDTPYVFVNQYHRAFYDYKTIGANQWTQLLQECGFRYRRMYEMRHTCATNLLMSGQYSVNEIAALLGHTSPQMLFERYTRSISSERKPFKREVNLYGV